MSETRALAWIRKSKGKDDDVGLELQREKVPALAEEVADEVEELDLGVHTGFSIHERDKDEPRIDANEDVQTALDRLENERYDYLVAWDDTRVARDAFFSQVQAAAAYGDCELVFVEEIDTDEMAFGVKREVEKHVKLSEIRKSKRSKRQREKYGCWDGPAPTGLEYDSNREYLVADPEEFENVMDAIEMRDSGATYSEIIEETGMARGTLSRVLDRREWYEWLAEEEDEVVIAKDGPACRVA